jgi:tetratricopeptide (TPR) repeat protein
LIWFNTTEKRLEIRPVSSGEPAKIMLNHAENVQQSLKRCVEVQDMPTKKGKFPNNLRACIKQSGYTVQEIAGEANIPLRTLFDYCAGKTPIPRKRLETLAALLGYPVEQIVPVSKSSGAISLIASKNTQEAVPTLSETYEVEKPRRELLQELLSIACFSLVLPPEELLSSDSWERLSAVITHSSGIDLEVLRDLDTITQSYWRLRANIASDNLLNGVLGHFQTITRLMTTPQNEAMYKKLYSLAGETAQIIGQMLFDIHDYANAWSCYKFSINAAHNAYNYNLEAVGLGRMSFLYTYSKQAHKALPLLQNAQHLARIATGNIISPWLSAIEAEVHASLRDTDAYSRAIERAEYITVEKMQDLYATGFNLSRLAGYKGACFISLGKPRAARSVLNEALRLLNPSAIRRQSTIFTDLAKTYVQQNEIEEACKLAMQALTLTTQTHSLSTLQRIRGLCDELDRWKETQRVKELNDQFFTTLKTITRRESL